MKEADHAVEKGKNTDIVEGKCLKGKNFCCKTTLTLFPVPDNSFGVALYFISYKVIKQWTVADTSARWSAQTILYILDSLTDKMGFLEIFTFGKKLDVAKHFEPPLRTANSSIAITCFSIMSLMNSRIHIRDGKLV